MNEIRIVPSALLPSVSEDTASEEMFRLFRDGQALRGRLVRQIDGERAFLHLQGKDLLVESRIPLPPGVELRFRVEELKPRVVLRLLPPEIPGEEKVSSLLKRLLSGDIPIGIVAEKLESLGKADFGAFPPALQESFKKFFDVLRHFSPSNVFSGNAAVLEKLVHESGFFWENKVREWTVAGKKDPPGQWVEGDLKGLGIKLLGGLEALRPQEAEGGGSPPEIKRGERSAGAFPPQNRALPGRQPSPSRGTGPPLYLPSILGRKQAPVRRAEPFFPGEGLSGRRKRTLHDALPIEPPRVGQGQN